MQIQSHNVLDTDKIGRLLMKLTAPMFFGMLVQNIYNIVDTIFIGHYVGSDGIAALSIAFPLQMLTMGVGNMVGIGGGSLISRLIGGKDQRRAERALGNSICFSIIVSLLLMLAVLPGLDFWLKLIGTSEVVMPFARDYLVIIFSGTVFNIASSVLLMLVRAEGNARVSMISLILQSVLNIILDAVFIIWLGMGMKGAALAMVISQLAATIYVISYYYTGGSFLKVRWRDFIPDLKIVKSIFVIGATQFVQAAAMTISSLFMIKMMANYGGDIALSAFGIIQRIMMFSTIPGMVLGQAMQPILGFNYGAKRYKQALRTISLASVTATVLGLVAFLVLFLIPEPIIGIFTSDARLIAATSFAARRIFLVLPLFSYYNVGQLVFPSIGKAFESFIIAVSRPLLFITPLILIFPHFWQMNGVWLAFPGSDFLSFLLVVALLIPLIIKFRKAAVANNAPEVVN
ncbi:MAG: MATE family efflux transporter [Dehalococcoidales bacterium]